MPIEVHRSRTGPFRRTAFPPFSTRQGIGRVLRWCVGSEGDHVLHDFVHPILPRFMRNADEVEPALQSLELVLKAGAKWTISERRMKWLRRDLIDGESKAVVRLLDMRHQYQALTPEQLHELTGTAAVQHVLNGQSKPRRSYRDVGYSAPPPAPAPAPTPPPQRGYWKRHWWQRGCYLWVVP